MALLCGCAHRVLFAPPRTTLTYAGQLCGRVNIAYSHHSLHYALCAHSTAQHRRRNTITPISARAQCVHKEFINMTSINRRVSPPSPQLPRLSVAFVAVAVCSCLLAVVAGSQPTILDKIKDDPDLSQVRVNCGAFAHECAGVGVCVCVYSVRVMLMI